MMSCLGILLGLDLVDRRDDVDDEERVGLGGTKDPGMLVSTFSSPGTLPEKFDIRPYSGVNA